MSSLQGLTALVYGAVFALALLGSAALTPLVGRLATALGVVALPRRDRWHKAPTPLLGGAAIYAASVTAILTFAVVDVRMAAVLAGASLLFATGLLDDMYRLRPHTKLLVQIGAACVLIIGGVKVESVTLAAVAVPLTIFWVVGLTNAFNLLDNMDGLAAGIASITALVLFVFSAGLGNGATAILSLAVMGGALGFLVHNFHPAHIFMGDSGSMFIGFVLSAITLLGTREMASDVILTLLVPVAIMGLPIFDTTLVTVARSLSGRSIAQGGRDHISHRLVALGLSERQTALVLYLIAAAFGTLALLSRSLGLWPTVGLATVMLAATAVFGAFLGQVRMYSEDRLLRQVDRDPGSIQTTIGGARFYKREVAQVLLDALLVGAAYLGAFLLKYGLAFTSQDVAAPGLPIPWPRLFAESLPHVLLLQVVALLVCQAYRGMWRYVGVRDLLVVLQATTLGALVSVVLVPLLLRHEVFPRSLFVIDWLLLSVLLVGSRASFIILADLFRRVRRSLAPRVLIVGAGDAGEMVLRFMLRTGRQTYYAVGFLDDDPAKGRRAIHGVEVLGPVEQLPAIIAQEQPGLVIVALPPHSAASERVLSYCAAQGIPSYDAAAFVQRELSLVPAPPHRN
ncbi:MAG: hypothetical protein HY690_02600 [Chloroflexi bacterium]|nr:hypothetical protein [Chloroflexota bacterium]